MEASKPAQPLKVQIKKVQANISHKEGTCQRVVECDTECGEAARQAQAALDEATSAGAARAAEVENLREDSK